MKTRRAWKYVCIAVLIWLGIFAADWVRVIGMEKPPVFCIETADGEYRGLGYTYGLTVHPVTGKTECWLTVFGIYAGSNITN